jgi:hypothetical protein
VYWSDSGELLAIATEESFYVLRFNRAAYSEAVASGTTDPNEGVEDAFDVVVDISERYPPPSHESVLTTVCGPRNGLVMSAYTPLSTDCSIS